MSNSSFEKALLRLCPLGDSKSRGLRAGIVATTPTVYAKHGITTLLVAQIGHECDAGHEVVETVRVCPGSCSFLTELSQHEAD